MLAWIWCERSQWQWYAILRNIWSGLIRRLSGFPVGAAFQSCWLWIPSVVPSTLHTLLMDSAYHSGEIRVYNIISSIYRGRTWGSESDVCLTRVIKLEWDRDRIWTQVRLTPESVVLTTVFSKYMYLPGCSQKLYKEDVEIFSERKESKR